MSSRQDFRSRHRQRPRYSRSFSWRCRAYCSYNHPKKRWYWVTSGRLQQLLSEHRADISARRIAALRREEDARWDLPMQCVPAHRGVPDKERADFLATAAHYQIQLVTIDHFVEARAIIRDNVLSHHPNTNEARNSHPTSATRRRITMSPASLSPFSRGPYAHERNSTPSRQAGHCFLRGPQSCRGPGCFPFIMVFFFYAPYKYIPCNIPRTSRYTLLFPPGSVRLVFGSLGLELLVIATFVYHISIPSTILSPYSSLPLLSLIFFRSPFLLLSSFLLSRWLCLAP